MHQKGFTSDFTIPEKNPRRSPTNKMHKITSNLIYETNEHKSFFIIYFVRKIIAVLEYWRKKLSTMCILFESKEWRLIWLGCESICKEIMSDSASVFAHVFVAWILTCMERCHRTAIVHLRCASVNSCPFNSQWHGLYSFFSSHTQCH